MGFPHAVVPADKRGQRDGFRSGKGRIPACTVLYGRDHISLCVAILMNGPMQNQLLARLRVQTFREACELFRAYGSCQPKLICQPAVPFALNGVALLPVVLLGGGELFLVILLGLAG